MAAQRVVLALFSLLVATCTAESIKFAYKLDGRQSICFNEILT
jgi:hypothetical protein